MKQNMRKAALALMAGAALFYVVSDAGNTMTVYAQGEYVETLPGQESPFSAVAQTVMPCVVGVSNRANTYSIISGQTELIEGSTVLIVDDICSRGGTFYHSAKALKALGAGEIYLYISHCENSILEGEILTSGLIDRVFTTNSILTKEHEKITVMEV